jgi:uncharacterized membrane protein
MHQIRPDELAKHLLRNEWEHLSAAERKVIEDVLARVKVGRDVDHDVTVERTFGQRAADAIATFGGSWTFIGLFVAVLIVWVLLNVVILRRPYQPFDPYPFIFLNLLLSMVAALQAPVIMMSQNRQASRDREAAANDYAVNLKAELEIRKLQEKMDLLIEEVRQFRAAPP